MKPDDLQRLFRELFGSAASSDNCEYARRKIAWHVQAEHEGGLPESARQHALAIARSSKLRLRTGANAERRSQGLPLEHAITTHVVSDHDSRLPMPGSVIVKKYKQRMIIVKVLSAGFEYEDRHFSSLTAIANEITGSKWNGFVFFGLARDHAR
jgi:hypothetical protein